MEFEVVPQSDLDIGRGTALLVSGALMMLLTWVVPVAAPLAIAAYGIYQITQKALPGGLLALAIAVVLWIIKAALGWVLWMISTFMVGFGIFFLLRGIWQHRALKV